MGRVVILCGAVKVRLLAWLSRVLRYPTISDLIFSMLSRITNTAIGIWRMRAMCWVLNPRVMQRIIGDVQDDFF